MLIHSNFPKIDNFELKKVLNNKNKSKSLKYLIVGFLGQIMVKDKKNLSFR